MDAPARRDRLGRRREAGEPAWRGEPVRRPILPGWMTSRRDLRTAAGWAWSFVWRTVAFHAVRLPVYGLLLAPY